MQKPFFDSISVIGLGYIGLPTAAMFAAHNVDVIGVDINQQVVDTVNRGQIHIIEPHLEDIVLTAVNKGKLKATMVAETADAFLITVPTPFKSMSHEPNLDFVKAACDLIAPVLKSGNLVILESTSPVGTTELVAKWLASSRKDLSFPHMETENPDICIAYCPERVMPGNVVKELIENDRIISGLTPKCSELSLKLYKTFVKGNCTLASHPRVAEMAKLTENSFRDVNIAFANELSMICDKIEIDVWELINLSNRHPRVSILQPGPELAALPCSRSLVYCLTNP